MRKRKHIPLKVKLAAALWLLSHYRRKTLESPIPLADAKQMTTDQLLSLFDWHHYPASYEHGGSDCFWNLDPIYKKEHRKISSKQAAEKRRERTVRAKTIQHTLVMAQKMDIGDRVIIGSTRRQRVWPKRKIPSRPFRRKK